MTASAGTVEFVVHPRLSLLSTGGPLPNPLEDTASGAFRTQLTGEPTDIPPVTDDLRFVPGTPQLDVDKTPENTTVQPGQLATFDLVTTNNGTANLPDLTVSDPLPTGILFYDAAPLGRHGGCAHCRHRPVGGGWPCRGASLDR